MSRRLVADLRGSVADEEGSILPLAIGYAILAIATVFVCACATSLYLAQQRVDQLADAAALAGADGFTLAIEAGEPRATLTDVAVREQAQAILTGRGAETDRGVLARRTERARDAADRVASAARVGLRPRGRDAHLDGDQSHHPALTACGQDFGVTSSCPLAQSKPTTCV